MARDLIRVVAAAVLLAGCAVAPEQRGYTQGARFHGDERIGQYVSGEFSFSTASYWIEGPDGLVIIDTQLVPSATRKAHDFAELTTGKKAKLAVVLHPSPDRFGGAGFLRSVNVPVVTSSQVRDAIPGVHARWAPVLFPRYHVAQYSKVMELPEGFGDATTVLNAAGLTLKAHVLGAGSASAHVVLEWGEHLFTGDLVSREHSWFDGGDIPEWLNRLKELREIAPRFVHPGRGKTGGPELIDRQEEYLQAVMAAVAAESPSSPKPADDQLARIIAALTRHDPLRGQPHLLKALAVDEWARQASITERR